MNQNLKKALLLKETNFYLINFLYSGYWVGEEALTYYDDSGSYAVGDLLGRLILIDECKKIILDEFFTGLYKAEYMLVEVEKTDFNRQYDTSTFKNWVGWKTKHKKYQLIEPSSYNWLK